MRSSRAERGAAAELLAERFLTARGLRVLERNFRCRGGEIDLIVREGDTLVFVEVRLRSSQRFGGAAASIDARKAARIRLAAQHYLVRQCPMPRCRFDAILLDGLEDAAIEWLRNVF